VIIVTTIKGELLPYLSDLDDPCAYWKKLQNLFKTHNATRSLFLIHKLLSIKMEEGSFISKYLKKIKKVTNQLGSIDEKLEKKQVVQITLSALKRNVSHSFVP
jgi:hypothetical protein